MASKFAAVFLVCMVAMQVHRADARSFIDKEYAAVFDGCMKACDEDGHHYTFCEVECDEDTTIQITDMLMRKLKSGTPIPNSIS